MKKALLLRLDATLAKKLRQDAFHRGIGLSAHIRMILIDNVQTTEKRRGQNEQETTT